MEQRTEKRTEQDRTGNIGAVLKVIKEEEGDNDYDSDIKSGN